VVEQVWEETERGKGAKLAALSSAFLENYQGVMRITLMPFESMALWSKDFLLGSTT
jgi:hypothetical protein